MQPETTRTLADGLRQLRETRFGSFAPVLLALVAIWVYFGLTQPAFLSPRNFYFLFMQSAVVGTLAVGITIVLLLGDIDLSAAATAGVCAALLAVLIVAGLPGWIACILAMILGTIMGTAQGLLVAYIGIPSFVVTLAGLLGFQGLMLKILGIQGAINMRDPIVRGLTTVTLPPTLGWLLAAACLTGFAAVLLRRQSQRRSRGLELESMTALWGQIAFFGFLLLAAVATLNSYRGVPLLVVLLVGLTALLGFITTSTPFGTLTLRRRRQCRERKKSRHGREAYPRRRLRHRRPDGGDRRPSSALPATPRFPSTLSPAARFCSKRSVLRSSAARPFSADADRYGMPFSAPW